jgi:amidase
VAPGLVAVAHGNDMGGSIRFPASMCGIVGLKPSRARTTLGPTFGEYWGPLTHEFVLTRSVRDVAVVLDAVAGAGPGDPYTAPPPRRPYGQEPGVDAGRLRVGIRTDRRTGGASHPDCVAAVERCGRLLEELGHIVTPATIPAFEVPMDHAFGIVMTVAVQRDVVRWTQRTGVDVRAQLEPGNAFIAEIGGHITATNYVDALDDMQAYSRGVCTWWEDNDILVTPTSPEPPIRLGELAPDNESPGVADRMGELVGFTSPFDVTGQPAISLPLHWNADGLPIGVQLVAAPGREDVLLRIAAQLESVADWSTRRPPIS